MKLHTRCVHALIVPLFLVAVPEIASGGPPLLCFPLSIGTATSLPWAAGSGWNNPAPQYDRAQLVTDTLALLTSVTPVLVRMETLRRATIYASTDPTLAAQLVAALRARVAHPGTASAALAEFDLGYTVEVIRQAQHAVRVALPVPADDGAALVRQALTWKSDPAIHYAVALMTIDTPSRSTVGPHLDAAVVGAERDPALARTLDAHAELWGARLTAARKTARR